MNYTEYEVSLIGWLKDASDEQCRRFGLTLISNQYQELKPELMRLLSTKEKELLGQLLDQLHDGDIDFLTSLTGEIALVYDKNEEIAQELDFQGFTEFLSMIGCWLAFRKLYATAYLTDAAMNRMDILDRADDVDGDWNSPRILAEIEHQQQILQD